MHKHQAETLTDALDTIEDIHLAPTFDVAIEEVAEVQEPTPKVATTPGPLDDVHMADVPEEETIDYEGSVGKEPAKLSSDDDDAWDSTAYTPSKHDTGKFSRLSAEDLKAINALDVHTPSREVKGNTTLLLVCVAR